MGRNRTLGAPYEQQVVTADFTTEPHVDRYLVKTPVSGPFVSVLLDPNAFNGDQVTILDASDNASLFPIVITPSAGQTINGDGGEIIESNGDSVTLTFSSALAAWTVETSSNIEQSVASPNITGGSQDAGSSVSSGGNIAPPLSLEVLGSSHETITFLSITASASYTFTPGIVRPVLTLSINGGGAATIFAFAESVSGQNDISVTLLLEEDLNPGVNTFALAFGTTAGDAVLTLGHGGLGAGAAITMEAFY